MAGDLNEAGLFSNNRTKLHEDSLLLERWQQPTAVHTSLTYGNSADFTAFNAPATGRAIYITDIIISAETAQSGAGDLIKFWNNTSAAGNVLFAISVVDWAAGRVESFHFNVPLKFTLGCYVDFVGTGGTFYITFCGWEE